MKLFRNFRNIYAQTLFRDGVSYVRRWAHRSKDNALYFGRKKAEDWTMAHFVATLSIVSKLATMSSAKWLYTVYRVYGTASRRSDQRDASPDGMK